MTRALARADHIMHSVASSSLADILERILDKGIVIAGEIKVNIVDIELLSIQIRLVVCSIDRAKEIGMNFWDTWPDHLKKSEKPQKVQAGLGQTEASQAR